MIPRLLVDALATYRLTKLVVDDQITAEWRDAVIRWAYLRERPDRWPKCRGDVGDWAEQHMDNGPGSWVSVVETDCDPPKLAYLVTCPHCSSIWLAFGVVLARRLFPRWWAGVGEALALSAVAGLVSEAVE